jgi:DNA-binding response OmpR family regulator
MVVLPESDVEALEVLFIADDHDLAEMYRLKLELDGYWVRIVGLDTAVAAARMRRPDIVFLDMAAWRPERLGILKDVRAALHRPQLPAIVLAPSRSRELKDQGATLSAVDYVVRIPAIELPALNERDAS